MSLATWTQSSRVGTTTSALGVPSLGVPSRCSSGTPKPRVLPVPVRAWPMTSSPARASGRVSSWMAKVRSMPTFCSAPTMAGSTPSSAKVGESSATGAPALSGSATGSGSGPESGPESERVSVTMVRGLPLSRLAREA